MAKFDISKALKKTGENLKKTAEKSLDSIKEIDLKESMKDLSEKSVNALNNAKKKGEEAINKLSDTFNKTDNNNKHLVTTKDALKLIYLLIAVDDELNIEEIEKFTLIGNEIDPKFKDYKDKFLNEMKESIKNDEDDEYYSIIRDVVKETIENSQKSKDANIEGKHLIWNLLAIAYSDGKCLEVEEKLIRFITKQLGIDKSIILEMESYVKTLLAIENEEKWLKQSNKPFNIVEANLNELNNRKIAIMQGVQALLID